MEHNIFDRMTILPSSVGDLTDESIYEQTQTDDSRIIQNVMAAIGRKKHSRKRRWLKRGLLAAAVCLLTAGLLSLPIVAENLYILYGSIIGGDQYTADFENVNHASIAIADPNLRIESLQVSGNGDMDDLIDIRLSRKNGEAFTRNEFNMIKQGRVMARFEHQENPEPNQTHDLEVIIGEGNRPDNTAVLSGLSCQALYGLEDDGKTLHILIDITVDTHEADGTLLSGGHLQGRTIRIKSRTCLLASVDNTLGTYEHMRQEDYAAAAKLQEENTPAFPYDWLTNSFYYSDIIYREGHFHVVSGRLKTVSLPFEISFTMEDTPKDNRIPVSGESLTKVFAVKTENGQLSVSPVGLHLLAKTAGKAVPPDMSRCYVTTKTGETYYLQANGCTYSNHSVMMNCRFSLVPETETAGIRWDKTLYLISPDNISRIVLNGLTIYQADRSPDTSDS